MAGPQKKSLDEPDERIRLEGVAADIVQVGDASISRSVFQPGAHCALSFEERGTHQLKGLSGARELHAVVS